MTAKKVLLVEDHAAYATQFRHALNNNVDVFHTAEEFLDNKVGGWEYAFVDFDLGGAKTGLSVMHRLKETSPSTKVVAFSELGDSGRVLGAAAAREWFNAWAIMAKGAAAHEDAIKRVATLGVDPTPDVWRQRLHNDGWLINLLFQREDWIDLWPLWRKADGRKETVLRYNAGFTNYYIRDFGEKASDAVQQIQAALTSEIHEDASKEIHRTKGVAQVQTVAFADANAKFFDAVDLPDAVRYAQPWRRVRS